MSIETGKNNIFWVKGLLNGILAWMFGFIIYMIPAIVVAFKMGFELGPKSDNAAAVSEQISQTISVMYQNNLLLTFVFIVLTSIMIFWRAKVVTKKSANKTIINGLLVAVFPVLFSILFNISSGFEFTSIIELLLFIGAGYAGGYFSS